MVEIMIGKDSFRGTLAAGTKIIQMTHFQDISELSIVKVTLTFPLTL